jgi:phosphoribosylformylglycinamidine synthase subunit PurQ / glutaminase
MKVTIIKFPGSHGAKEVARAFGELLDCEVTFASPKEEITLKPDLLIIPGGFSYGDYLRPGAFAKSTRIAGSIRTLADKGVSILGIGNGFQILCELNILPGVLFPNKNLDFVTESAFVKTVSNKHQIMSKFKVETTYQLPLACYSGRYFANRRVLLELEDSGHVAFRYVNKVGNVEDYSNLTGSDSAIAGITNIDGNVLGIMFRPERFIEDRVAGSTEGLEFLKNFLN